MTHSPYAVDVKLPSDLVTLLGDVATEPTPARSTVIALLAGAAGGASTAITFLQGPPALGYWIEVVKGWLRHRREGGLGEISVKGPGGAARFVITEHTDLGALAEALHIALFPASAAPPRDLEDIGV